MPETADQLRTDHANMRRLLDLLERELDADGGMLEPDYLLMLDIMDYVIHYEDLFHHPREELLFDRLLNRHPEKSKAVQRLRKEHRMLARTGARLRTHIRERLGGVELKTGVVQSEGQIYVDRLRKHMRFEEEQIFAQAGGMLRRSDWQAIDEAISAREDPVFGRRVKDQYLTLYQHLVQKED